MMSRYMIG